MTLIIKILKNTHYNFQFTSFMIIIFLSNAYTGNDNNKWSIFNIQ